MKAETALEPHNSAVNCKMTQASGNDRILPKNVAASVFDRQYQITGFRYRDLAVKLKFAVCVFYCGFGFFRKENRFASVIYLYTAVIVFFKVYFIYFHLSMSFLKSSAFE